MSDEAKIIFPSARYGVEPFLHEAFCKLIDERDALKATLTEVRRLLNTNAPMYPPNALVCWQALDLIEAALKPKPSESEETA